MTKRALVAALAVAALLTGCARPDRGGFSPAARRAYAADIAERPAPPPPVELTEESSLPAYLAYAAWHNPGLEAAFNRWRAGLERIPQVTALPDPRLTYRYYVREVETRVGAMRQGVGLTQVFPWVGKLELQGEAAAMEAAALRQRFESARLQLFYTVQDGWWEYYYLGRSIAIVQENLRLVQRVEEVARIRYRTAAAEQPDVIRAQVELGRLEDRLASLRDLQGPLLARLNAALNRPLTAPLPFPSAPPVEPVELSEDRLLAMLSESNPELRALDAETLAARARVRLAEKEYYPDVMLGLDYTQLADSTGGRNPSDDGKDAVVASASINLPIWYDKLAAGVRQAEHNERAAALARAQRTNDLAAALKMALYRFRDAERKISLYRDTLLPKSIEALATAEASFRAGRSDFTDVIDAQRVLLEFELSLARALADRAQRLAELETLVGCPLFRPDGAGESSRGRSGAEPPAPAPEEMEPR